MLFPNRRCLTSLFVLALLVGSVGCTSVIDGERGLLPIATVGPGESQRQGLDSGWAFRPLAAYRAGGERSDFFALWPIIKRTVEGASGESWVLPLWYDGHRTHIDGTEDHDGFVLPIFLYGDDDQEGAYFTALPIGGVLKGLLGQDEMIWGGFPLYLRMRDRTRVSTHVLFPFYNRVTGPYRSGWRIWPFYGRYTGQTDKGVKKYDRRFYLWPLFHAQENNLDTTRPVAVRWFWPFWGDINATTFREQSVLWPLVSYRRGKDDPRNFRFQLFPVLIRESWVSARRNVEQTDIFPLFGVKRTPSSYRQFILYPIHRHERVVSDDRIDESTWCLPLYWHYRTTHRKRGIQSESRRLYPLWAYQRREDGTREWRVIDPFPFDDGYGFDALYGKLFRIFEQVDRGPYEGRAWEALWGFLQHTSTPREKRFRILGGLFETRSRPGRFGWRLLWIPFGDHEE